MRGVPDETSSSAARFRRLLEAVWLAGGDMARTAQRLGVDDAVFGVQLSRLRRKGLARTVTLMVLERCGEVGLSRAFVRMPAPCATDLAAFEAFLCSDRAVKTAALVSGRETYQLTTFHDSPAELRAWRREIARRFPTVEVVMRPLKARFGHEMTQLALLPRPYGDGRHEGRWDTLGLSFAGRPAAVERGGA